jgi:hypothetical protein
MTTKQLPIDFPEVQAAIYGVALSLDAFLLNGVQYGVLQQATFPGFLEKTAGNLTRDLANLEKQVEKGPVAGQPRIAELLGALRTTCRQLIDLVTGLGSLRALSLEQVRSSVSLIPLLRGECVQLIQELEVSLGTPKPFYPSRPAHSSAAMTAFLANLERGFTEAWAAANAG